MSLIASRLRQPFFGWVARNYFKKRVLHRPVESAAKQRKFGSAYLESLMGIGCEFEKLDGSAMSSVGIVATFLGVLVICSRGPLLLVPASALRWFGAAVKTKGRTRIFGVIAVLIAVPMIWSGVSETTGLAGVLFIFGVFVLVFAIPALVLFPSFYMSLSKGFVPDDLSGNLLGWRILGLVGVIIGVAIVMVGVDAL